MAENKSPVSAQVEKLYEDIGWSMVGDVTFDAQTAEDLRPCAADYVAACRRRVLRYLPTDGARILDMASGPIQYPEYLDYSRNFTTRVCVDLSQRALDMAAEKIGAHGEYLRGDFLDLDIAPVDAAVSLHTIYHIDQAYQERAVRKIIQLLNPGGVAVIVYGNPDNVVSLLLRPLRLMARLFDRSARGETPATIYFKPFPLRWWRRFEDSCDVAVYPWRTLSTRVQRRLIPSGERGRRVLVWLFRLEDRFPRFFTSIGVYPMIVLHRK